MTEHLDSYDVPDDWALPATAGLLPAGAVRSPPTTEQVVVEHFDTADRDLLAAGVSLTRRTGDVGEGWELILPTDLAVTPRRRPLGESDDVPADLAEVVSGIARGRSLASLATVRSDRTRHRWVDDAGEMIVDLTDTTVRSSATIPGAALSDRRREVGVERGPAGRPRLGRRLAKALRGTGATATDPGDRLTQALDAPPRRSGKKTKGIAAAVIAYLGVQDDTLITEDVRLRSGEDDVHAVRVATRRARSTLRIFADLFDPAAATWFSGELSWYADLLGEVRDPQVQRARFGRAIRDLPDELVLGPVAATIEQHLLGEQLRARAALREAMAGDRYHQLLRASAGLRPAPTARLRRASRGDDDGADLVDRAGRKALRRLDQALATDDDEQLHRARKAAKRARYAAELSTRKGKGHKKAAKKFKKLQDILGEHQDSVVAAELLRRLGAATHDDPTQNGFTFGVLHERELRRADSARDHAHRWRAEH